MDDPQMAMKLVSHHRPGFYFRVPKEGEVEAGDEIVKIADGPERMTIAVVDALLYLRGHTRDQLDRALRIPALSEVWQESFKALLQEDAKGPTTTGNPGLAPLAVRLPRGPDFGLCACRKSNAKVAA